MVKTILYPFIFAINLMPLMFLLGCTDQDAEDRFIEKINLSISNGKDINAPIPGHVNKFTYLHVAVTSGYVRATEFFLEKGADINIADRTEATPMHRAVQYGEVETTKILIEHGADIGARDSGGQTPLFWAVRAKSHWKDLMVLLLEAGAEVDTKDYSIGSTSLANAVYFGETDIVDFLIRAGADVNIRSKQGKTPLHTAASIGRAKIARILLENGADVNVRDKYGETPLRVAIQQGNYDRTTPRRQKQVADVIRSYGGVE